MQRFRRKSESKKRSPVEGGGGEPRASCSTPSSSSRFSSHSNHHHHPAASSGGASGTGATGMSRSTSASSSLSLPEPEEFRTSLILPHLTARFELLRGQDGQLVDYETLTSHLDEQRKTGRLTTFEMDAVLQQYKLQSAFEANQHPLPTTASGNENQMTQKKKKKRIDWSGVDLEKMVASQLSRHAADARGSGGDGGSNFYLSPPLPLVGGGGGGGGTSSNSSIVSGSPTSSRNSFVSFLPNPSSSPPPPSVSPTIKQQQQQPPQPDSFSIGGSQQQQQQQQYVPRRDGSGGTGTLFGSRSSPSATGMTKSQSQNSLLLRRGGGEGGGVSEGRTRTVGGVDDDNDNGTNKGKGKQVDQGVNQEEEEVRPIVDEGSNRDQIKTISRASSSPGCSSSGGRGRGDFETEGTRGCSEKGEEGEHDGNEAKEDPEVRLSADQDEEEEDRFADSRIQTFASSPKVEATTPSSSLLSPLPTLLSSLSIVPPVSPISPITQNDLKGIGTFQTEQQDDHENVGPLRDQRGTESVDSETEVVVEGEEEARRRSRPLGSSDTEPVDPLYTQRISSSSSSNPLVPPPDSTTRFNPHPEAAIQTPLPPSSSSSANSLASLLSTLPRRQRQRPDTFDDDDDDEDFETEPRDKALEGERAGETEDLTIRSSREEDVEEEERELEQQQRSSRPRQRQREYTSETDTTQTSEGGGGGGGGKVFSSFPFVPNRRDLDEKNEGEEEERAREMEEEEEGELDVQDREDSKRALGVQEVGHDEARRSESRTRRSSDSSRGEVLGDDDEGDLTALASSIPLPTGDSMSSIERESERGQAQRESLFSLSSSTGGSSFQARESIGSPTLSQDRQAGGGGGGGGSGGGTMLDSEEEIELADQDLDHVVRESHLLDGSPRPLSNSTTFAPAPSQPFPSVPITQQDTTISSRDSQTIPPRSQLDRLPSGELLAIASNRSLDPTGDDVASPEIEGDKDLVLEDLVVIQQALVKRAEEKKRLETLVSGRDRVGDDNDDDEEEEVHDSDELVESLREEPVEDDDDDEFEGHYREDRKTDSTEDEDDDIGSSSIGSGGGGMGSRKDSAETGITSTGAFDFGDELAGLGLSSLSPSSNSKRTSKSKKRESTRSIVTNATTATSSKFGTTRIDTTGLLGPQSSLMELQTSQSSSSPGFSNSAITPSTTKSDAFEFSSLAGSPDVPFWGEQRDDLIERDSVDQDEEEESIVPLESGLSRSVAMQNLSLEDDGDFEVLEEEDEDEEEARKEETGGEDETEDQLADLPDSSSEVTRGTLDTPLLPPSLGAAVQLDDNQTEPVLRVPRNMPRRDPASTTSMLIRDVRNQATLATFALKKTPTSPPSRSLSKKSIRKGSISSPHLVSAPADMATVPIVPSPSSIPPIKGTSPASRSPRGTVKNSSRTKSRKDKDTGDPEGSKPKGLGLRFKMLLKKQSRDQLTLNGDEITPFVDFASAGSNPNRPSSGPPPVTPPNQDTARFNSPGSASGSDFPRTPTDDPTTPLAKPALSSTRSPPRRPPPPSLDVVEELVERSSPPISVNSDPNSRSPAPSHTSGKEGRGLNRFVSRLRKSPVPPASRPSGSEPDAVSQSSIKRSFEEAANFGLGIEGGSSTKPLIEAQNARAQTPEAFPPVASTAPLSVGRNSQASLAKQSGFSFPSSSTSSSPVRASRGSESVKRTSGHPVRASTDSMQRLWEAAEDLGLPPDKVQELVDSAYAQSPTTSHGRSGSSFSTSSPRRKHSNASHSRHQGSTNSHTRHTSETSSSGGARHGRKGSTSSSRSLQDRVPTPPPDSRHQRKVSLASSREAGPIPDLPASYLPPSSSAGSRLSVSGSQQFPPPASPSLGSIVSSRRSGYADSFLDFYAQSSDGYEDSEIPPVPPLGQQFSSERSLAASSTRGPGDRTLQQPDVGEEEQEGEGPDEIGGEVVWQVLSDLRNNRLSTLSKDSSFGFDSRDSSFEVDHTNEANTSADRSESIANMLRHRDRKRSSTSMPPFQAGRFPSIYVRDEEKLLGLEGGVAKEQEGHFFVRPKDASSTLPDRVQYQNDHQLQQQQPPLPEEYRQLIASASSRHGPTPSTFQDRI